MLRELHISGLGVIDDAELHLDPGLNVLTGETGAGKTLITVGLALVLGRRGSAQLVREGARSAKVGARFDGELPAAARQWIDDPDDGLVLSRTIAADGKGSARVAGQLATVSALAALEPDLVEVHGQHESQRLLHPPAQAAFLDRFAGAEHLRAVGAYRDLVYESRGIAEQLRDLAERGRDREREIDLLTYQVREIEEADPSSGELEHAEAEEARLANAERLVELAADAAEALAADGGGSDALSRAATALAEAAELDPGGRGLADRATGLAAEAAELARDARDRADGLGPDPAGLQGLRERIHQLRGLRKKYGEDDEAVVAFADRSRARLEELQGADDRGRALLARRAEVQAELDALGRQVSRARRGAAPDLAAALERELHELGMDGATVHIQLEPSDEPALGGPERVELLLAPGTGQRQLPLGRAASGGELSRVMLACRSVLADLDAVPTLVFDEVDAGIGGTAGMAVGRRLAKIAATHQVLVVTHLPQIAAFADRHFHVGKRDGTATLVALDAEARVAELSRMLAGMPESGPAAVHAEELLAQAGRGRPTASSARS